MFQGQGLLYNTYHKLLHLYLGPSTGYLSVLMQEAFDNISHEVPFVLEATTAKSRDRYLHMGFEVRAHPPNLRNWYLRLDSVQLFSPFRIGVKNVDEDGLTTRGGPGVEVYSMVHVRFPPLCAFCLGWRLSVQWNNTLKEKEPDKAWSPLGFDACRATSRFAHVALLSYFVSYWMLY